MPPHERFRALRLATGNGSRRRRSAAPPRPRWRAMLDDVASLG